MIYFVQSENGGPIKIGYSARIDRRISHMQVARADRLKLLRSLPGGLAAESWLHTRYAHLRLKGEWFNFDPDMLTVQLPAATEEAPAPLKQKKISDRADLSGIERLPEPTVKPEVRVAAALAKRVGKGLEISYTEFAKALGTTTSSVHGWMTAKTMPNGPALEKMVMLFGASFLQDVFGGPKVQCIDINTPRKADHIKRIAELQAELEAMG